LDSSGNVIYKNSAFQKTTYDPRIISSEEILKLGQEAASIGYINAKTSGVGGYNADAGGVSFRVYIDKLSGKINNFHPR
jgi:hypothetical protein